MKARYTSPCPACRQPIEAGSEIVKDSAGRWVHPACKGDGDEAEAPARDWSSFTPSIYQRHIRQRVQNTRRHLIVEAVAGSGKSTTLEWLFATALQGVNACFAAFNRSIAGELKARLGRDRASTLNALGHRAVARSLRGTRLDVRRDKYEALAERWFPWRYSDPEAQDFGDARRKRHRAACRLAGRLASLVRGSLADPHDEAKVRALIDHYGVDVNGAAHDVARILAELPVLLDLGVQQATESGVIDYDDQIWLPHRLDLPVWTYDVLCLDEAQDLNAAQHALALRLIGGGGRMIAVGDSRQAIYGFRGAMSDSLERLSATLRQTSRGVEHAPLSACYRCPTDVIDLAQTLCPEITAPEGRPVDRDSILYGTRHDDFLDGLRGGAGWLVLCRTNAPLAAAAFRLLARKVRCRIQGRDIGESLIRLLEAACPRSTTDLVDALDYLQRYVDAEVRKLSRAGRERQVESLQDRHAAVVALSTGLEAVEAFNARIRSLFDDREGAENEIVFSSIHRAKGLEHDRVAILRPDLLPHPLATRAWEKEQERNLEYVAITRAKEILAIIEPPEDETRPRRPRPWEKDQSEPEPVPEAEEAPAERPEPVRGEAQPSLGAQLLHDRAVAMERACEEQEPLAWLTRPGGFPWPSEGDGSFTPPTLEDWVEMRDAYREAGLIAELVLPPAWQQWALSIGGRVQVSTTVGAYTHAARDCGDNAIDIVLLDERGPAVGAPIKGARKVLRTDGWQGRMHARVVELLKKARVIPRGEGR